MALGDSIQMGMYIDDEGYIQTRGGSSPAVKN
jgi:hypothetical protein